MEPETQTTFPTQTGNAATAVAMETNSPEQKLYPLDQQFIQVAVKKGIVAGEAQFATITLRRPSEKELLEREKKSRAGLAQITQTRKPARSGRREC